MTASEQYLHWLSTSPYNIPSFVIPMEGIIEDGFLCLVLFAMASNRHVYHLKININDNPDKFPDIAAVLKTVVMNKTKTEKLEKLCIQEFERLITISSDFEISENNTKFNAILDL